MTINILRCSTCTNFIWYYKKSNNIYTKVNRGQCKLMQKEYLPTCPACNEYVPPKLPK